MESMNLVVVDKSPESAERINSLLRNSGIKIHVISASKVVEIKRVLDQDSPLLVVYTNPDANPAHVDEVSGLARQYAVPFAVYSDFSDPAKLLDVMKVTACIVVHSENETQLTDMVKHLAAINERNHKQRQQQEQLEELTHRYELLLESASDAMAYIHEGLHVYANRAYLEVLHVSDISAITGISLLELMQADGVNLKTVLQGLSKGERPTEALEVNITRPDGTSFEAQLEFSPVRFNGEACTQMLVHERDAMSGLATELDRMRITDPLTELKTKRFFVEQLETELAKPRTAESVSAILYLEPDGFSQLQAEFDLEGMEAVIADMALVLKSCLGPKDDAARISDHGIAVLTKQANMEQVEELSEKILKTYAEHLVEIGDRSLSVSCSIGIATLGRLAKNWSEVIAGARKAQTEAAETGNAAVIFRPQLTAVSRFEDDRQWIDRIKLALHQHDFCTVQHSIIDLDGEGEQIMENLTYLRDLTGNLGPDKFMTIADRNDLAGAIDRQIIPGLLKSFVESGDRQVITLSNNSILDYAFPGWLKEQMTACCVEPTKVILQVNAATVQANLRPVQRLMQEFEPLGCKLSLSGFDAELRTRQLLEHIGASYVKIHPSLTENLTRNSANHETIRQIVDAAESRGACVIADEVSDTSSLATLWQCGVKLIAGAFLKEKSQVVAQ
jgi:diguanylate cyclase (GGDEF)-like protein/PAS domain S-box-containing protein